MKEYIVTVDNEKYLVMAKDAKDAINQVWEEFPFWKREEFKARGLGSLHNEYGKIVKL